MICDPKLSYAHRAGILRDLLSEPLVDEQARTVRRLLDLLAGKGPDRETEEKRTQVEAMLQELQSGPWRVATLRRCCRCRMTP